MKGDSKKDLTPQTWRKVLRACALEYNIENGAPQVKWYAEGDAAQHLINLARSAGIEIASNQAEQMLLALKQVKPNSTIPAELYWAIAQIYAYLSTKQGA